jgi:hypothetical protein
LSNGAATIKETTMKATGVLLICIDAPPEHEREFNAWYDLDHMPEVIALPGVISAQRYYAEDNLFPFRTSRDDAPPIGQARFCNLYLLGDADLAAAQARMGELGKRLQAEKRLFRHCQIAFSNTYRLIHTYAAKRIKVSADALPYIGHRGLQVAMGSVPNPADIPEATEWWHSSHYPDMLEVPGWAGALKCEPLGEEGKGRFLHLFLLDKPAKEAHDELEKVLPAMRASGKSPHPRGIYRRSFSGPWSRM